MKNPSDTSRASPEQRSCSSESQIDELLDLIRLFAEQGLRPDVQQTEETKKLLSEVEEIPSASFRDVIQQVLISKHAKDGLQWLSDCQLLSAILPEVAATVNFAQEGERHHKDVWEHTKQVIAQSVLDPIVRWSALFHDIGKVPTRAFTKDGKVTFHGHAEVGAQMFEDIADRLAFPDDHKQAITFLVRHHLRANQYDYAWSDSAVRRFYRQMEPQLDRLMSLSRADMTSANIMKQRRARERLDDLKKRIDALKAEEEKVPALPAGIGAEIMECFQLQPGREIGRLKARLEDAIRTGALEAGRDSEYYLSYLSNLEDRD